MFKFCSLYSGSSGNSQFVSDGQTSILVDAGMSGKKIIEAIKSIGEDPGRLSGIFVTHEHADHIKGVGVLSRLLDVPIYGTEKTWVELGDKLGEISRNNKKSFHVGEEFYLGDLKVKAFSTPHDAVDPVGFNLFSHNKKITIATDLGYVTKSLYDHILGSDFVLLEANHDIEMVRVGPYPWHLKQRILGEKGHLSNEMAGKLVAKLVENGVSKFSLGHLSKDNNFPELVFETVKNVLLEKKIKIGQDVSINVAIRDRVGEFIQV
jgi:phosphoribosyl 1,2-cyclic phosphodiesterase